MTARTGKKLIEVALPLEAINEEGSRRKRKAPSGYPTALHKWWAQRPLAAARAVVFAQMVDDPSAFLDLFPTEKAQEKERQRLFRIIENLVKWENTSNDVVLERARDEIWTSWRRACAENVDHPQARELFDRNKLPPFLDPFAGSGAIPLEAQRLGLEAHASDLNPVAVLINKAMIEIPPKFAGQPPVNSKRDLHISWKGAYGLANDVRFYGQWMLDEAAKRIGGLYPSVEVTADMAAQRPDLKPYVGQKLTVVAWLWARTVKSPNPAFANVEVPLASTFMLSTKAGKEVWVEPIIEGDKYSFAVRTGKAEAAEAAKSGTKLSQGSFKCLMSGSPFKYDYIDNEANSGRMGTRLMAIVAEGKRGRVYLSPTPEHESLPLAVEYTWKPDTPSRGTWGSNAQGRRYGFNTFGDYFTDRQLVALTTFSDLVGEAMTRVRADAAVAGLADDSKSLREGSVGATAYAEAVGVYLAFALDRMVDFSSTIATWRPKDSAMRSSLAKQAIPMSWDFAEGSPFGDSSAGFLKCVDVIATVVEITANNVGGMAYQKDARAAFDLGSVPPVKSTDPPYYDNVGYADLSDFFYPWMRRSLRNVFPDLFTTLAVPKAEELVASSYRHGGKEQAERFFLEGMTAAMKQLREDSHPAFPVTIYYAFKQSETESDAGTASTGWEVFLAAVIRAGFSINGTWPMRTEGDNRQVGIGTNALPSSIVLVCRPRPANAAAATRRQFVASLKAELPDALHRLQAENIAPVDLAQAAIGPGMAVYTRYAKVIDAKGAEVTVHDALTLINEVLDDALAEQEGDVDSDSRWALAWFEQNGFSEGEYGTAELLSKAKVTTIAGLVEARIVAASRGKVRLLRPDELDADWDPVTDKRLTAWEMVHQLVRALDQSGEAGAAGIVVKLGGKAEIAKELAYRLYVIAAERRKRAAEARPYDGLVKSWPEIVRLAQEGNKSAATAELDLFNAGER